MDTPKSKRRKTGSDATPGYASYMSPTKSTLARYNPTILATRSKSAQPSPVRKNAAARDLRRATIDPALLEKELQVESLPEAAQDEEGGLEQTEADVEVARLGEKGKNRAYVEDDDDEDDLPETPQKLQNAPEFQDSPPRGMLFSSGARRRKQKEIPVQIPDPVIVEEEQDANAGVTRPVTRSRLSAGSAEPTKEKDSRSDALLVQLDEKRNELNALRKELKELRKGMTTLERHIDMTNLTSENDAYKDISGLLSFASSNDSEDSKRKQTSQSQMSTLLTSFLPFSIPLPDTSTGLEDDAPVPSHSPLPDTPALLGLFSSLDITTSLSVPSKPSKEDTSLTQTYTINLSSPHSLLNARIAATVSTTLKELNDPTIQDLKIEHISPWAKPEIAQWLASTSQAGDITSIGYALGRYWEISIKRAQCWAKLYQKFPHLIPGETATQRSNKKASGKRRHNDKDSIKDDSSFTIDQLRRHLGRSEIKLKDEYADVRISWALSIDWSGEVESKISAKSSFPMKWHEADGRASLKTVNPVFEQLLAKYGASEGMAILVNLLFKDET